MSQTRRIPIIPTIVVVAASCVMVALGVWQLGRADEKTALIARFEANQDLPIITVDYSNLRDAENFVFRRVRVNCSSAFLWEAVAGRNRAGQTGYVHRYTCINMSIQRTLPSDPALLEIFGVIGWARSPEDPDWQGGEIEGVLAPLGDNFKLVSDTGLAGLEAAAVPDPSDMPNNHLAYAGQWFFFALTALLIYGFALRRRWGEQG